MDLCLKGKVAVVTGASRKRGNGRAIAIMLAEEGADVACVDVEIEGTESIAAEIKAMGRKSFAVKVDQTEPSQVKAAVATINSKIGPVDKMLQGRYGKILTSNASKLGDKCRLFVKGSRETETGYNRTGRQSRVAVGM